MTIEERLREIVAELVRDEIRRSAPSASVEDGYITTRKAAELAAVHPATIRRWIADGRLPTRQVGSPARPRFRVLRSDLDRVLGTQPAKPKQMTPEERARRDFA